MKNKTSKLKNENRESPYFSDIIQNRTNFKRILGTLRLTPKVFLLVWSITPWHISLSLVLRILLSVIPIVQLWLGKILIDGIVDFVSKSPTSPDKFFIFAILVSQGLLFLVSNAIGQIQSFTQDYVGKSLSLYNDFTLREKILSLDLAMLENSNFHNQYVRASLGAGSKALSLVNTTMNLIESIVTIVLLGAILLALEWPFTVMLVLTTIPNIFLLLKYSQKSYDLRTMRTNDNRRANYHASLLSIPSFFKEIKILQIGEKLLSFYKQYKQREFYEDRKLLKKQMIEGFVAETGATLAYYSALGYILFQALRGSISIGGITFFIGSFSRCQSAVKSIISAIPTTHDINIYVKDFLNLKKAEPELIKRSGTQILNSQIHTIEFRNVSFCYPRTNKWILKNINLTVKQGEKIGLVGTNGAGKSTLIKLLCRLYEPTKGDIYVNGINIRELDIEKWHKNIGIIFQDFSTFMDSIKDNIGYGNLEHFNDLPYILEAAQKGQADAFIRKQPNGYDTILGREYQKGEQLSGGQLQRLALSRLFMRDADLFILDEPAFSLDPISEYEFYESFNQHCEGKISFIVSHRFSTMRMADYIIVLDGKIIEEGTHEELMRIRGVYADLYDIQFKDILKGISDNQIKGVKSNAQD